MYLSFLLAWRGGRLCKVLKTALVVGPLGEEICPDKYGWVKVQFHWDRVGKYDGDSCWIRVSQAWAGKSWGAVSLPRIGQEVIVDFLEGDPNQPIITSRVYNGEDMPPYALPDQMTKTAPDSARAWPTLDITGRPKRTSTTRSSDRP